MSFNKLRPELLELVKTISKIKEVQEPEICQIAEGLVRVDWWIKTDKNKTTRLSLLDNVFDHKEYGQKKFITRRKRNDEQKTEKKNVIKISRRKRKRN